MSKNTQTIFLCGALLTSCLLQPGACAETIALPENGPTATQPMFRLTGTLKNETAYRIATPRAFTKIRNQLLLAETGALSDALRFKISGRAYYDAVYDATHHFPANVESDQKSEVELRDTYLDYSHGPWDMRLGKQQIVWGEAVALFFADTVNARDLREFILPDFDMIRIPQWGTDIEFAHENFHAEFVWLPVLAFDKLGVSGSEFAFPLPLPSADTAFTTHDPDEPENSFEHSVAGLRLSRLFLGWDINAFYLHGWTKSPVYYRSITAGTYNFDPRYRRLDTFGATVAKEVKEMVFKGEFVFNQDDYFSTVDASDADGVRRKSFLNYLVAADYTFFGKISTSLQFMQKIIFGYEDLLAGEEQTRNDIALWLKTDLFDKRLEPELTVLSSLKEYDALYRPRLTFKLNDNWLWRIGADIFQGQSGGVLGKYRKKSRCYCEVSFTF